MNNGRYLSSNGRYFYIMSIKHINPTAGFQPNHFTQCIQVHAGSLLFISGQTALNQHGQVIGKGDLQVQTVQVFENLKAILASVNSGFSDVVKLNIFVVNYRDEDRQVIVGVQNQYIDLDFPPASTLIGVQSLARSDLLIEVEAVAAIK